MGDSFGVGVGVSVGLGDGAGDDFFRFGLGVSSFSGTGVGELLRLRGEVDFEDAPGDGVGLLFPAEGLCRRWLGVGVGVAKNVLIFSPNEGSSVRPSGVDTRKKRKTKSSVPTDRRLVRLES